MVRKTIHFWLLCLLALAAPGQSAPGFFPHASGGWYLGGQINFIYQDHGAFAAAYSGTNSFLPIEEQALSRVYTFYSGVQLGANTELLGDVELANGDGLSSVLGLAGFTNLDAVRNPTLSGTPYFARLLIHEVLPLGPGTVAAGAGPLSTMARLPTRRFEFYAGKFSMVDFFDVNAASGSSHWQFMNWTISNNGAYDYAADTRGYTVGALAAYQSPGWGVQFAEALMPTVANGPQLEWNLRRAHAENLELQFRPQGHIWRSLPASASLLLYVNTANMGTYRTAVNNFLAGLTPQPEIANHAPNVRHKPGLGLNLEQSLPHHLALFARTGFASGRYEAFAYTEVEQTVSGGLTATGAGWQRPNDVLGLAAVVNGISGDHRRYLADGGLGFLLGDGRLQYAHERVAEAFYSLALGHGFGLGPDFQYVVNPGYNAARGPVLVYSARAHLDF